MLLPKLTPVQKYFNCSELMCIDESSSNNQIRCIKCNHLITVVSFSVNKVLSKSSFGFFNCKRYFNQEGKN